MVRLGVGGQAANTQNTELMDIHIYILNWLQTRLTMTVPSVSHQGRLLKIATDETSTPTKKIGGRDHVTIEATNNCTRL